MGANAHITYIHTGVNSVLSCFEDVGCVGGLLEDGGLFEDEDGGLLEDGLLEGDAVSSCRKGSVGTSRKSRHKHT